MIPFEIKKILDAHKAWLRAEQGGERADLRYADLRDADLRGAHLTRSILRNASLRGANLHCADLYSADLCHADLYGADLRGADLRHADLHGADLRCVDLRGANIDYSTWPLWCGSLGVRIDSRMAAQLLYHVMRAMRSCSDDPDVAEVLKSSPCIRLANKFHRADECGRVAEHVGGEA